MTTTENQNDKTMETTTTSKSIIISSTESVKKYVLAMINNNKMSYRVLGHDQNEAMILQIDYKVDQQNAIEEICNAARFLETLSGLLTLSLIGACQHFADNAIQAPKEVKMKHADGNEKGE